MWGERRTQVDFRLAKLFRVQRVRMEAQVDLYNALNGNTPIVLNGTYGAVGATPSASWLTPQVILPARLVKFGVQVNF
jgi:hypothetical protein